MANWRFQKIGDLALPFEGVGKLLPAFSILLEDVNSAGRSIPTPQIAFACLCGWARCIVTATFAIPHGMS
jgi:hypothetical protein